MKKMLPVLALTIMLSGCFGETTVDTSSVDALNESVKEISEDLQAPDRKRFQAAIKTMVQANKGEGMSLAAVAAALEPQIGGKTAAEVVAIADAWTVAEEKRIAEAKRQETLSELDGKISEYTAEIARLEQVIVEQNANAKKVLGEFSASDPHYFWRGPSGQKYPVIDLAVTNNHARAVENVVIHAVLRSAGKAEPIVDGQLRYEFPARLTPGKTEGIRFEPDEYGDWAKAELEAREDLELSVEIANVTFPGGGELIRTYVFRGDDPVLQVESLNRRLKDANAERDALMAETAPTSS